MQSYLTTKYMVNAFFDNKNRSQFIVKMTPVTSYSQ